MSNRKQIRAMDELEEEEISARPNRKQRRSGNALEAREPAAGGSNRKQMRAMDEQEEHAIAANQDPEQEALAYFLAEGMISEVLYRVSRGKEATVYCCQATPLMGAELLAVKVYRPREHRGFKNDAIYQEGRVITNGQVRRAVQKKSKFGRQVQFDLWINQEFKVLTTLHRARADVPKPLAQTQSAILMEYFGNRARPASSLQGSELSHQEARATFDHLMNNIEILLANNYIHGDLSGYNILYWQGRARIIDFPQAVDPRFNSHAHFLLSRDIERVCEYFTRYDLHYDARNIANRLWYRFRNAQL